MKDHEAGNAKSAGEKKVNPGKDEQEGLDPCAKPASAETSRVNEPDEACDDGVK